MKPIKEPGFDPIEDIRQAGVRLEVLRYLALVIFVILSGRLWYLQIMNTQVFADRAEMNRTRVLTIPARRGNILDRKGRLLASSQPSYNIVISRKDVRNFDEISDLLVGNISGIEKEWLKKRFEAAIYEPKYESIVVKELATNIDVQWVEAHQFEYPMIRAEEAPRRFYPNNELAAHALGYVGEVSRTELNDPESPFNRENSFKLGDIIGKAGIERTYNDILSGKDGERRVIVDSRGRIQREIERIEPIPGRDIHLTIDLDVQKIAEEQASNMPLNRGVIVVSDPRNGEVLALVSHPAYNPNIFSLKAKTEEGKSEIRDLYENPDKPLYNRVIQGTYPPGSTWKLMTTVAALNEGVITPENSRIQDGGIQLGNYFMKSLSHLGAPDVVTAIARSADGYYYRLGLKMGPERFEKWVRAFRFGERTGIDLPREKIGILPTRAAKAMIYPKTPKWTDYDMAASAFGQGTNALTPIQLLRYVNGLAVAGRMYTPHLFMKAAPGTDRMGNYHEAMTYTDEKAFKVQMSDATHEIVLKGMWGAVNGAGTAGAARVEGFDVCGKTGTAQNISTDKVNKNTKDHAWFMGFAPRDKPEISAVILTENAGFGGTHSAPRARAIFEDYYRRTRGIKDETLSEAAASPTDAPRTAGN
ncbi:MAG: penicillin-binding protein 2 [Blastocatellales bacterium]